MCQAPPIIHARSHRQAMDWSLVLASQNIQTTIEAALEGPGYNLLVAPEDYENATRAIRLYRLENRHWLWRNRVWAPDLLFDWRGLLWVLLLGLFFWITAEHPVLRSCGVMDGLAVSRGEHWRLFTAMWLHADVAHLAGNAVLGFVLVGLAMGRYGSGEGLLASYLAGLGGNLVVWLFASRHLSLGASGMVMGSLGLLTTGTLLLRSEHAPAVRLATRGVFAGVLLFILLGLNPETDVRAHLGGFVTGVLLGVLLAAWSKRFQDRRLSLLSALVFALLVIWPWWLAFRHALLSPAMLP